MKKFVVFLALVASVCFAMPASAKTVVCESTSCGKSFVVLKGAWQVEYFNKETGVGYYYEVLDKTAEKNGFKVKPMAIVLEAEHWYGNEYRCFHLQGCEREMASVEACLKHLRDVGFQLKEDGAEPGGPHGKNKTAMRGEILKVPDDLIKK